MSDRYAEDGACPPGRIRRAFIWNITCANHERCRNSNSSLDAGPLWDYAEAPRVFRQWGWRLRRGRWLCPECVREGA